MTSPLPSLRSLWWGGAGANRGASWESPLPRLAAPALAPPARGSASRRAPLGTRADLEPPDDAEATPGKQHRADAERPAAAVPPLPAFACGSTLRGLPGRPSCVPGLLTRLGKALTHWNERSYNFIQCSRSKAGLTQVPVGN